jgi:reverse transcriptase-like protein
VSQDLPGSRTVKAKEVPGSAGVGPPSGSQADSEETSSRPTQRRSRIGLNDLADPIHLKWTWKRLVRKLIRQPNLKGFELAHDPLEYLAFEWEIDAALGNLTDQIRAGTYRASPPELIRAAKGLGITRPISHLQLQDLLVYRAIVAKAETSLRQAARPWARMGRRDENEDRTAANSGWFLEWLRRRGMVWTITAAHKYLVETDIANFYPYVQLDSVLEHLLANSSLGEACVRLLGRMLREFSPISDYKASPIVGLPQEGFEASRIIAHTYLKPLDEEFRLEGDENRFARYVDDIAIGAHDLQEAFRQIGRVQRTLEPLGLYPNTAKTRILQRHELERVYFKAENDYLGTVDSRLEAGQSVNASRVESRMRSHLRSRDQGKEWLRVVYRYYTLMRRTHNSRLTAVAFDHLVRWPESARDIFEYLATFRITAERLTTLRHSLDQLGGVYEDVELLAHEYVCNAPNTASRELRNELAGWGLELIDARRLTRPRMAASASMTVGKFGTPQHFAELRRIFDKLPKSDNALARQLLVILHGGGLLGSRELLKAGERFTGEGAANVLFLQAIESGEQRACALALGLLKPVQRGWPTRFTVRPRMLFIAPRLRDSLGKDWDHFTSRSAITLRGNGIAYRDAATIRWLGLD